MKYLLLVVFCSVFFSKISAQNLVPNPSLEDNTGCPNDVGEIYLCKSWHSFGNSPDYFSTCGSYPASVPNNLFGKQQSSSGNSYAGLYNFTSDSTYREYLGSQLNDSLIIGEKYFVTIKVSLANNQFYNCPSNHLGIKFSTQLYDSTHIPNKGSKVQVYSLIIISDTIGWTTIKGYFIADSSYKYIIIGNFFNQSQTDTQNCGPYFYCSYYYVDDVCVSTDSNECYRSEGLNEIAENDNFIIYPCPADNYLNINVVPYTLQSFSLVDLLGREIIEKNVYYKNGPSFKLNISSTPSGIYILILKTEKKEIEKKIIISHSIN